MSVWPNVSLKSRWGRIELLPPSQHDDDAVAALRSDPIVLRYVVFPPKAITAAEWKAKREAQAISPDIWNFHVHLTPTARDSSSSFAGQCCIWQIDIPNRSGEIGILISSSQHRTGVATETLYLVLSHAFEYPALKLHRVQFVTAQTNVQMRGWCERFGMGVEFRLRHEWEDGKGGWIDGVGYSILEDEWPDLKAKLEEWLNARI